LFLNIMTTLHNAARLYDAFLGRIGHEPTNDQSAALKRISRFLAEAEGGDIYVLKGYAGTGKTTLISSIVRTMDSDGVRVVLMAPTGRAAKVLSSYSGRSAFTIHRRIYRTSMKDGMYSGFKRVRNKGKNTLYIVDEASMITGTSDFSGAPDLLSDLIQYVKEGDNCRLILVGDSAQLPPVGEILSPALDARALMDRFGIRTGTYELKEVVRQESESGILHNATLIREALRNEEEMPSLDFGFEDFYEVDPTDLPQKLTDSYSAFGPDEVIIICRSNKAAGHYNRQIRYQSLYFDEELSAGDRLMCVRNNYHWIDQGAGAGFIANGDILRVNSVRSYRELHGFRFAEVSVDFVDQDDNSSFEANVILDGLYTNTPSLTREQNQKLYKSVSSKIRSDAGSAERKRLLSGDPCLHALQVKFAYAVTCHKAQGGQWAVVFIDRGLLKEDENDDVEYMRWLYTAVTRATGIVYMIGNGS
jgi:exodeoxyribonuclease-5